MLVAFYDDVRRYAWVILFRRDLRVSPTFCVIPWMHRFTNEQGEARVCCTAEGDRNRICDASGKPIHVLDGINDPDILNTSHMKQIRKKMLDGRWDEICARCKKTERFGGASHRTASNSQFRHLIPDLLARTAPDGGIESPTVSFFDMRLGTTCNLACRMCGPWASSLWIKSYNEVQPEQFLMSDEIMSRFRQKPWTRSTEAWEKVEQQLPYLEKFHFAGGEPLMIPEMFRLLEFLVESGRSRDIDLSYNTNLTILPERLDTLWPKFRSVTLACSIDGYGRLNEYIRRPSVWGQIDANLRTVDENFDKWKIRTAYVSTTVQSYNALHLGDLHAYLRTGFRRVLPLPNLVPLYMPAYLSIQTLPGEAKAIARERLMRERNRPEYTRKSSLRWALDNIDATLRYMDDADQTNQIGNFLTFTRKSDAKFNDDFATTAPDLARILSTHPEPVREN
jgi:sulfatase maturation enzyme AslB (radical SAM superfamily)